MTNYSCQVTTIFAFDQIGNKWKSDTLKNLFLANITAEYIGEGMQSL